ncbi:MAG: hypothetical protein IPQ16_00335 [Geobacteraceae bacterium]|nr:hypothetical protein [Geobacteraceae bacterium]
MKSIILILCFLMVCGTVCRRVEAAETKPVRHQDKECCKKSGEEACSLEKRGWCGKRRGDWYGARRPVTSLDDARQQLVRYYSGQQMIVAEVAEKQWRYEADVLDNCGKVVDRVMIDKRSGRVRSIY